MEYIADIFATEVANGPTTVLDNIMDEITLESANAINEEYQQILSTYAVMSKVINTINEPESITTECGVNTFDNFVTEQLATVGLTKEYFGFEGELTIEAAQVTIEVNEKWKKMWEWIKEKVRQIKDWVVKVFKALFNKNKTLLQTIESLEKINLGTPKQNTVNREDFTSLVNYLPNINASILAYADGLNKNWYSYGMIIDKIIGSQGKDISTIYTELKLTHSFSRLSDISVVLSHSVYSVKGVLLNITGDNASYYCNDGATTNKIVRNTYTITNKNTKPTDKVMTPIQVSKTLEALKDIVLNIDKNSAKEVSTLNTTLDAYKKSMDGIKGDDIEKMSTIILLIMGRLTVTDFTNREISKLVRAIAVHIKCYQ